MFLAAPRTALPLPLPPVLPHSCGSATWLEPWASRNAQKGAFMAGLPSNGGISKNDLTPLEQDGALRPIDSTDVHHNAAVPVTSNEMATSTDAPSYGMDNMRDALGNASRQTAESIDPFAFFSVSTPITNSSRLPRRESKFAPLLRGKNPAAERARRRDVYLQGVRERGDTRRWETRGEMSLQRDFLAEQRAWEEAQARDAETWCYQPEEESVWEAELDEVDPALEADILDEDMWYDDMDVYDNYSAVPQPSTVGSAYGDDEEYEQLMLDMAALAEGTAALRQSNGSRLEHEMDM